MLKHYALLFVTFAMFQAAYAADHIPINSCADLKAMGADLSAEYYLTQNIECEGPIAPIPGTFTGELTGMADASGARYTIRHLTIQAAPGKPGGLFEKTNRAIIDNINFENAIVLSDDNTHRGLLAADMLLTLVENVNITELTVSGTLPNSVDNYLNGREGGLAGSAYDSGVLNVHISGVKIRQYMWAGGMFGEAFNTQIKKSSVVDLNSISWQRMEAYPQEMVFGGLVGYASYVDIIESSAQGTLSSPYNAGGLIGAAADVDIIDSYSQVDLYGSREYAGGLIGRSYLEARFQHVYAAGLVNGDNYARGMIGSDNPKGDYISTVTEGYFDKDTTGREHSGDSGSKARSTKRMTKEHDKTFAEDKGWSRDIWVFVDGQYPVLVGAKHL